MHIDIAPPVSQLGRYTELREDRQGWQRYFAQMLADDERMRGHVLDVGCGPAFPKAAGMNKILLQAEAVDGVEPSDEILRHRELRNRWRSEFESADIPDETYDAIYTFNVIEHIRDSRAFLQKAFDALKPGGVIYAATPHAHHPFAVIVRMIQMINLRSVWRSHTDAKVNDYPAYYRLNSLRSLRSAATGIGFSRAVVHYYPCMQWDCYFPRILRWVPHLYDFFLATRFSQLSQQIMFVIEKPE